MDEMKICGEKVYGLGKCTLGLTQSKCCPSFIILYITTKFKGSIAID